MQTLTQLIEETRKHYLEQGYAADYRAINSGLCAQFAEELEHEFKGVAETISNDLFMVKEEEGWNGNGLDAWNAEMLNEYHSQPNYGLIPEDLEHFVMGYHAWIYSEGRHYDAECPEGVENMFDLPFFERHLRVKKAAEAALQVAYIDNVIQRHADNPNGWSGECVALNGLHIGLVARVLYKYFDISSEA